MANAATIEPEDVRADPINTGHAGRGDTHGAAQPWRRQSGETSKAFSYFSTYLRLGPHRSLHAAAALVGKSHQNLLKFANRFSWAARVEAFDRHVEKEDAALWEEQRREARKRQMQWELQRQAETRRIAELLESLLFQFEGVRLVNAKPEPDGAVTHEIAKGAGMAAAAVAMLAREFVRVSRASIEDLVQERKARWKEKDADRPLSGQKEFGAFSCGDLMYDDSQPPPLPVSTTGVPEPEAPSLDAPERPLVDLTGVGNLYNDRTLDM